MCVFHLLMEKHTNLWSELFFYVSIDKCFLTGTKHKLFLKYFFSENNFKYYKYCFQRLQIWFLDFILNTKYIIHNDTSNFYNFNNQKNIESRMFFWTADESQMDPLNTLSDHHYLHWIKEEIYKWMLFGNLEFKENNRNSSKKYTF